MSRGTRVSPPPPHLMANQRQGSIARIRSLMTMMRSPDAFIYVGEQLHLVPRPLSILYHSPSSPASSPPASCPPRSLT
eukprot:195517-Hanusia_phi.AAC.3